LADDDVAYEAKEPQVASLGSSELIPVVFRRLVDDDVERCLEGEIKSRL
jgi:hypothetical protein